MFPLGEARPEPKIWQRNQTREREAVQEERGEVHREGLGVQLGIEVVLMEAGRPEIPTTEKIRVEGITRTTETTEAQSLERERRDPGLKLWTWATLKSPLQSRKRLLEMR